MSIRKQQGSRLSLQSSDAQIDDLVMSSVSASRRSALTHKSKTQDSVLYRPEKEDLQPNQRSRLEEIKQQKEKLQSRLNQLAVVETSAEGYTPNYEENITRLMRQKQKMEEQQAKSEAAVKKMQADYERKREMERRQQMERVARQKIELEREIINRQTVLNAIRMRTDGLNSEVLLDKALSRELSSQVHMDYSKIPKAEIAIGLLNDVQNNQQYMSVMAQLQSRANKTTPAPLSLAQLNDRRLQIHEKQQKLLKKKILLKEFEVQDPLSWQKLNNMSEEQMEQLLDKLGHNVDDFRNSMPRELILQNIEEIQQKAEKHIKKYRQKIVQDSKVSVVDTQIQKNKLKLEKTDPSLVVFIKRLIDGMVDKGCQHYQNLLKRAEAAGGKRKDEESNLERLKKKELQQADTRVCVLVVEDLMDRIAQQTMQECADEMYRLHQLGWNKTLGLVSFCLNQKNQEKILKVASTNDILLNYSDKKPRIKYKKDTNNSQQMGSPNVYDAVRDTSELISDLSLLQLEQSYFRCLQDVIIPLPKRFKDIQQIMANDILLVATNKQILSADQLLKIPLVKEGQFQFSIFGQYWLQYRKDCIILTNKGLQIEQFNQHIGDRVGNEAGNITSCCFYPITTILGTVCSILVGFNNGSVMKYNLNKNPVTEIQSNMSYFEPMIEHLRSGEEPNLPNQHRSQIQFSSQRISEEGRIHQYREFFRSKHTTPVMAILFYKPTKFVTIGQDLKCALWSYDPSDNQSYEPDEQFQIKIQLKGFKYSENSVLKSVPLTKSGAEYFVDLLDSEEGLKNQIYASPKTQQAIYRVKDQPSPNQFKMWRVLFNIEESKVTKIYEQTYVEREIRAKAMQAKLWRGIMFVCTQRPHVIKQDLITIKIVGWQFSTKKLKPVSYELDVYTSDKLSDFLIVDSITSTATIPGVLVANAGRIVIFSMITGQMVRVVVDPDMTGEFEEVVLSRMCINHRGLIYACNQSEIYDISFEDNNEEATQVKARKEFERVFSKYIS